MPIRVCLNGHVVGGHKICSCGAEAVRNVGGSPLRRALDKKTKRDITAAIRDSGEEPFGSETAMGLKRYLLFLFIQCEPRGGWSDFAGAFDTFEEARWAFRPLDGHMRAAQIVDTLQGGIVYSSKWTKG